MRILPKPIAFQWDQGNIYKNLNKHSVTTQEAEEVFVGEPFLIIEDAKHSTNIEQRFHGLGHTKTKRKLFVVFTIRDKKIRIISVRDMKRKERQLYEEFEENS
ncbi:MAG TPA: BrnT family toxin [Candidatus Limnocylindria bacterium]|nr:BrnT family toxin [Candidatus Limnocylindria bacterium]